MSGSAPQAPAAPGAAGHIDVNGKRKPKRRMPPMPDSIALRSSAETGCHESSGHRWVSREAVEDDQ